jgi:hypothetical protein
MDILSEINGIFVLQPTISKNSSKLDAGLVQMVNVENCIEVAKRMNFKIYDKNVNIWGVRVPKGSNFNDIFFIFYKDYELNVNDVVWKSILTYGTTEPDSNYLQRLINKGNRNPNGIAVLISNKQYEDCFVFGLHKGKYEALQQYWRYKFTTYRKKKDEPTQEYYSGKVYTDVMGLNFHTTRWGYTVDKILGFSEGCQVVFDAKIYFQKIIPIFKRYKKYKMSYTLVDDSVFYDLIDK